MAVHPGGPAPDLAALLALAGPDAARSDWTCSAVECFGPRADDLRRAADAGPVPGWRLVELAAGVTPAIDGVFEATRPGDDRPWLAVRAIDGCYFVVVTRSRALLDDLRRRFTDVRPSPDDATWHDRPAGGDGG